MRNGQHHGSRLCSSGVALCARRLRRRGRHRQAGFRPDRARPLSRRSSAIAPPATRCPAAVTTFAGGRPIETPFGDLLAPNITPDPQTGIGAWTDDEFVNALTKGTGRDGTHLYPAMPYTYYTKVTRDDALAIRAYLNTVPAVHNRGARRTNCRFRSMCAPAMVGRGTSCSSRPGAFRAGRRQERRMESRRLSCRGPRPLRHVPYAEEFPRRRRRRAARCRAMRCRAGSRPTSPTISGAASAAGRSTTSSLISRPATIGPAPRPARWRRRSISRPRR